MNNLEGIKIVLQKLGKNLEKMELSLKCPGIEFVKDLQTLEKYSEKSWKSILLLLRYSKLLLNQSFL